MGHKQISSRPMLRDTKWYVTGNIVSTNDEAKEDGCACVGGKICVYDTTIINLWSILTYATQD